LQVERTVLAHRRTQLAAAAVALLLVREAEPGAERLTAVIVACAALLLSIAVVAGRARQLQRRSPVAAPWAMTLTLVTVASLQLLGTLLVVV
jgi:hypothetical protein